MLCSLVKQATLTMMSTGKTSPESLSGAPKTMHQDVSFAMGGEKQHVLPEQAYLNTPFRSPVSPNHDPQEPKHHKTLHSPSSRKHHMTVQ